MKFSLLAIGLLLPVATMAQAERPNVLWLTSEDNGPHLGCYGDEFATTPHLDALAARGMRFINATSNAPVCAPARTTIITGLYPPSTGAEHMRSEVGLPAEFSLFPQLLRAAGYYCTNNVKEDYNVVQPGQAWDESSLRAHWRNRPAGQPFFAVFNATISHESRLRDEIEPHHQVHDPAHVPVPPYHPDHLRVRRDWAQYYDRLKMMDGEIGNWLKQLNDAGLADDTIVFYYADHGSGMPRNKRWLYMSGLRVPMIVYFPPKWQHLAPPGYAPGGESDRLVAFIDLAPTVLSLAGIEPPRWMQGSALAGPFATEEPEFSYGFRHRMDERYDLLRSVRTKRYNYIRNYAPHRVYGQHQAYMWQTPTTRVWKRLYDAGKLDEAQAAFWQTKPVEELYDLENDPHEIHNLADSPEHSDVMKRLRHAQQQWAKEIKDVGFLHEWEMHARARNSTPYEMGHDPERYDFEAIFAAAELATSLDKSRLPEIAGLLEHDDSAVRYWGAVGLLAQEKAGIRVGRESLLAALADNSPIVRITAAEALGRFGSDDDAASAREVLLCYAGVEPNYFLAVAAWNALDYLDERARPALSLLRAIPTERGNVPARLGELVARLKEKTLADLE